MPRQRVKIPTRWQGGTLGVSFSGSGLVEVSGQAVWNLPDTISVQQSGTVNLRQYAVNADGWQIVVANLPAGVAYNSGTESLEGAATGTSSGTATFTLTRIGGSDVVDTATVSLVAVGDNVVRIDAILDNYTRPSNLVALQYPADPVTTTTHEVRTDAQLASAISGSGRLIRIYGPSNGGQATYGSFDPSGRSDIDIVMDNDATISRGSGWRWDGAVRRLRWTGGNVQITSSGDGITITDLEDALFDNVRMFKDGSTGHILLFHSGIKNHRRIGVINSTIEHLSGSDGNTYSLYIDSDQSGNSGDWVFAGNRIRGQATPFRLMWPGRRAAIVGNYLHGHTGGQPLRIHQQSWDVWVEDNICDNVIASPTSPLLRFDPSAFGTYTPDTMENFRVYRNRVWATAGAMSVPTIYRLGGSSPSSVWGQLPGWDIDGNIWHDPTGPSSASENNFGGITITNPYTRANDYRVGPGHPSYEAAPPAQSNYGADH